MGLEMYKVFFLDMHYIIQKITYLTLPGLILNPLTQCFLIKKGPGS